MQKAGTAPPGYRGVGAVFVSCGVVLLWGAWLVAPEAVSTLRFATLGVAQLPSRGVLLVCGILSVGLGLLHFGCWLPPWLYAVSLGINTSGLVLSTLVWASIGGRLEVVG